MRIRGRGWTTALVIVVVVVLLGSGVALAIHLSPLLGVPHTVRRSQAINPNAPLSLHPERDGLTCPVDVAWSRDSSTLALIGYSSCPNAPTLASAHSQPQGIVLLYDTSTGKRIVTLHPDQQLASIARTSGAPLAPGMAPFIRYQTIMWSPDGRRLALPFFVEYSLMPRSAPFLPSAHIPLPATTTIAGVLLYAVTLLSGQTPRFITASYRESAAPLEWNLATGKPISRALTLAPALSYRWGANGALLGEAPLTTNGGTGPTTPSGPIGDPMGGARFSLWQPGELAPAYLAQNSGVYTSVPGACFWSSQFGAWSPDGAYLVTPGFVSSQLNDPSLPTPDPTMLASALAATSLGNLPLLAPRDTALLALCQRLTPNSSGYAAPAQAIAWRPDGAVLAATIDPYLNNVASAEAAQNGVITLYDSATGKPLRTLTTPTDIQAPLTNLLSEQSLWLRWSPNGARIVLLDLYTGTLTLWRIGRQG